MRITLISLYPDITSVGIRTLSAYVKKHGYKTMLVFLPDPFGDDLKYGVKRYPDAILDNVVELCRSSNLIGISLMTNFFDGAVQITEKLKSSLKVPVIWGGVHPTICPEESLRFADLVCIGEGEDVFLELCRQMSTGEDFSNINNIWVKQNGRVIKNPVAPPPANLDAYSLPDYSMDDHHIMLNDSIVPLTHTLTKAHLKKGTVADYVGKIGYQTLTSRGCPHKCAYCINHAISTIYERKYKLRWRSVDHVIKELLWVRKNMSYVDYIWLSDDEFMARKYKHLVEFCRQYKQKINLPFSCLVSPLSVTEEKMAILVDAGLVYIQMGVESGSPRMQKIYNRKQMSNTRIIKAMKIINKYKDRMLPPSYDFLIDAPYEKVADKVESLQFISNIPKPYRLQPFVLILYPATQLYLKAKEDGLILNEHRDIYNKSYTMREPTYLNLLITLARKGRFPSLLLKLLIQEPLVTFFNMPLQKRLVKILYLWIKNIYNLLKHGHISP